jgi:hypothetical protein
MTSSTIPSCGCSDVVVYDPFDATISSWFGAVPLILGASLGFSRCPRLPASSVGWPCPSSGVSMSITAGAVYEVFSTMGVGLLSVVSDDDISSTLTTFGN